MKDSFYRSDSRRTEIDDCAASCREAKAHSLQREEASGVVAPTAAPHSSFFSEHGIAQKVADARPYIPYEKGDPERLVREHWATSPQFAARVARQSGGLIIPRYAPASLGLLNVPAELRPDDAVITSSHHHYHGDGPEGQLIIPTSGKPLPKRWIHKPGDVQRHIEKVHGGINVQTVHLDHHRAKYVFPPGDGARRLDMHPEAWTRFANASRVFFVIEGCIKSDAVLSAGEAVFSVPSVTLWDAPELTAFSRTLRGKLVYIVPDADWRSPAKPEVMKQALFCRTRLRRLGVRRTFIAAPPFAAYLDNNDLKGIDDHLAQGGTMDDLEVMHREPRRGLAEYLAERGRLRDDRLVRAAETLEGLALHADSKGEVWGSLRSVARIMNVPHSRVQRAIQDLEWFGVIGVDGELLTRPRYHDRSRGWISWDWVDRPTITIVPELRARDSFRRLGG